MRKYGSISRRERQAFRRKLVKRGNHSHVGIDPSLQTTFLALVEEWHTAVKIKSSIAEITGHPAYRAIIEMGQPVIPFILKEMEQRPDHWFIALEEITGKHPDISPEDAGNIKKLTKVWLEYARSHDL